MAIIIFLRPGFWPVFMLAFGQNDSLFTAGCHSVDWLVETRTSPVARGCVADAAFLCCGLESLYLNGLAGETSCWSGRGRFRVEFSATLPCSRAGILVLHR